MLNNQNICTYLLSQKLITLKSVVEGDLLIRDASSRNTIFLVNQFEIEGAKLLIKQPDIEDEDYIHSMKIESDNYAFIHQQKKAAKLRPFVPNFHQYDSEQHILVLGQLTGVCRLYDYLYYGQHLPDRYIIKNAAKILANFHTIPVEKNEKLQNIHPWILDTITPKYIKIIKKEDKHAYTILKPLYDDPQVIAFIQKAKTMWKPTHFTHLDTRLTNFMMPYTHQPGHHNPLWIIDLELAGMGDVAWDIGIFIGELLLYKTYLLPKTTNIPANNNYLSIDAAIKLFLKTYLKLVKNDEALQERIILFTTIKVFLCIYEYVVDEPDSLLDKQLKSLIALFYDMLNNQQKFQKKMMP
jgi:thiamine kinase-like enzyme